MTTTMFSDFTEQTLVAYLVTGPYYHHPNQSYFVKRKILEDIMKWKWFHITTFTKGAWISLLPASNATSGDIITTLASAATVAVAHPTLHQRWLQIAGSTVCHLTLQRGLRQWTQSVLASWLDRRQGDPRQMAEIRKLHVNLQLLKSK